MSTDHFIAVLSQAADAARETTNGDGEPLSDCDRLTVRVESGTEFWLHVHDHADSRNGQRVLSDCGVTLAADGTLTIDGVPTTATTDVLDAYRTFDEVMSYAAYPGGMEVRRH